MNAPEPLLTTPGGLASGRTCLVCQGTAFAFFRAQAGFTIVSCEACGLRFLDPQPDAAALEHLYAETYYHSDDPLARGYARYTAEAANWRATFPKRLPFLPPAPARLLDVGAAAGFFVEAARHAGYDAKGVEPSKWASDYARVELGQPVETGMLEAMGYPDASFDIVTLWEVIEHLPDPRAFLLEVARILAPGGTLAFSTPDAGSLAARLSGRRWLGWQKVPEHLWFFDKPGLIRLLEECGFGVTTARYVSLTVTWGFALDRLGTLLGFKLPVPGWLAGQSVSVNPGYDLMLVARKGEASLLPEGRSPLWRWGLSFGLLALVGWQLARAGGSLAQHPPSLAWEPLLASFALLFCCLAFAGWLWRRLVAALGVQLPYRVAFSVLFRSNLAKYLPGGVWNLVGRVVLAERAGVPKLACSISILMETACQVVAALLVGLVTLPVVMPHNPLALYALGAATIAIILGMHPRVLNGWLSLGERLTHKPLPRLPFSYGFVLGTLTLYTLNWLCLGLAFALLGQALSPQALSFGQWGRLTGSFALAWNVGVFAFFLPAGLGVREAALVLFLASAFPPGWPAVLALVARVWFMLAEVSAFGLASAWSTKR